MWKSIGTSHEVSVSSEGVEELKGKVKIKGEKKEALLTPRQKPESDSLPPANAQNTKTYYKHHDSSIKKVQVLKNNSSETNLQGRLLESFQEDGKYEHVVQDTRSQYGKDDKDKQGKDVKILERKDKVERQRQRLRIKDHTA
uniref:Uncharacterized protein n=1 Tax=Tanacetum cinerariifolium TaxID=118510 RepID=A0A699JZP4_TANCI|nr:hypothetical protein [Tanacetum cinerariifolium]